MGQEISQQSKLCGNHNNTNTNFNRRPQQNLPPTNYNEKLLKHKQLDPIYAPTSNCSTSSASSTTDDEHYRQKQKYNLHKQAFEKTKVAKKLSSLSNNSATSSTTITSTTTNKSSFDSNTNNNKFGTDKEKLYYPSKHQRRHSQSTDSGIYYSSCYCSSSAASSVSLISDSAASLTSGCGTSVSSNKSHKSLDKQKQYLNHHLYIKSYLDILEEDEKARANYKPARPGGIRNYTPKILAETPITVNKPAASTIGSGKLRASAAIVSVNPKEDPWI